MRPLLSSIRFGSATVALSLVTVAITVPVVADAVTRKSTVSKGKTKAVKSSTKQLAPNGRAPKAAGPFLWDTTSGDPTMPSVKSFEEATTQIVPNNKIFKLLIIGSDARPNENYLRTRGDSLHVLLWNPAFNKGVLVGIPRDSYVTLKPTNKRGKINSALTIGGPQAVLDSVNALSGLNISNYVITGFKGMQNMVNDIGGVNVFVNGGMKDTYSGAMFQNGWFAMNGDAALAFTRNRKTLARGDFDRSSNQGRFMLATLAKLREEVSDVPGLVKWVRSFQKNATTNLKPTEMLVLAQMARSIDPANVQNLVLNGKSARVGKEDVVNLSPGYTGLFTDVGRDAVADGR
jgi:polyisoprenyl-teichoic acid--peptidoglycan teichoic acid transferase